MISKIYYSIVAFLIIVTLVACELFETGFGDKVDLSDPVLTIDSPINGSYIKGSFILKGTVTDDTEIDKVVVEYLNATTGDTISKSATVTENNWSLTIDTTNQTIFNDGDLSFTVTASDTADKTSFKDGLVIVDNTSPTVLVQTPNSQDIVVVNGILDIRGSVVDQKVDRVEVYVKSTTDTSKVYGGLADGTSSWKYELDTLSLGLGEYALETFYVEVKAYDKAGNSNNYFYYNDDLSLVRTALGKTRITIDDLANKDNYSLLTSIQRDSTVSKRLLMKVDQYQDRPKIILPEWDTDDVNNYRGFLGNVLLTGNIVDDDGINSVVISIYKESDDTLIRQGTASVPGSTDFNIEVKLAEVSWPGYTMTTGLSSDYLLDDLYYFVIYVEDLEGTASGKNTSINMNFGIDQSPPSIEITTPVKNANLKENFTISGTVYDQVNITGVTVYINNTTPLSATVSPDKTSWTYDVDVSLYSEGDLDISVLADDGSGKTDSDSTSYYLDKTDPILNPANIYFPANVNGIIKITGKYTESQIDRLEYNIGGITGNAVIDGSNWSIEFDVTQFYSDVNKVKVFDIIAYDKSGRSTTSLGAPYNTITVNESSDIPVVIFNSTIDSDLTAPAENNLFVNTGVIGGSVLDDDGVKSGSIIFNIYQSSTLVKSIVATETYNNGQKIDWNVDLFDPPSLAEGIYTFDVTVKDNYLSKISGVESEEISYTTPRINFIVDKGPPTLKETSINTTSLIYKNSDTVISGTATDGIEVTNVYVTYSKNGGVDTELLNDTVHDGVYSTNLPVSLGDGEYYITIEARDPSYNLAENEGFSTLKRRVQIDTQSPILIISSPVSSELIDTNTYTIRGQVTDNGGKGISQFQYSRDNTNWTDIPLTGFNWSVANIDFSTTVGSENLQGSRTLYVRASDGLNPVSTESVTFNYDTDNPVLTETVVNSSSELISKDSVNFGGVATDSNQLSNLSVSVNGGAPSNITVGGGGAWTYSFPNTTDGSFELVFTAKDSANRTATITRKVLIDTTIPDTPIISSLPGDYVTNSLSIDGTSSDSGSGISKVEYSIDGGAWNLLSGKDNWFKTIDLSGILTQGSKLIEIKATDKANNQSLLASQNFMIDRALPILTETLVNSSNTKFSSDTVSFSGLASDTNSLVSLKIYQDNTLLETKTTFTGVSSNEWSYTTDNTLVDGDYEIKFIATDIANRTSEVIRNVTIDSISPVVTVNNIVGSSVYGLINISGTIVDENVDSVKYQLDSGSFVNASITEVTPGNYTWSGTINVITEGESVINVVGYDKSGATDTKSSSSFKVDMAAPSLIESNIGSSVKADINTDINLVGTASDSNSLVDVKIYLNGTLVDTISTFTGVGNDEWSYFLDTATATPGEKDGSYQIKVVALDIVNKSTEIIRNFLVDTLGPIISTTTNNGDSTTIATPLLSGSIADYGSGLPTNRNIIVDYVITDKDSLETTKQEIFNTTTSSWSGNLDFGAKQGSASITITSVDKLGNSTTTNPIVLYYDAASPVLTETGVNSTDTKYATDTVTFSGVAYDTNKLTSLNVYVDGVYTDSIIPLGDNSWTYTTSNTLADGTYAIKFIAKDIANKTTEITRNIVIDSVAPTLTVATLGTSYSYGLTNISGTIFDAKAVDYVEYQLEDNSWEKASLTTISSNNYNWKGTIEFTVEGLYTLNVRALDKAGNITNNSSVSIMVDASVPTLTEINISNRSVNTGYSLSGTVSDSNAIQSLKINGSDPTTNVGGNWTFVVAEPSVAQEVLYNIIATDIAGRTTNLNRTVKFDKTIPTVNIDNITGYISGTSYTFKGSADDNFAAVYAGIEKVQYQITEKDGSLGSWVDASGSLTWNGTFDLTSISEGYKTIHARSIDSAGNISNVVTKDFTFDQAIPSLAITVAPADITNGAFTISGTASDSNGLLNNQITIKIDENPVLVDVISGLWSYTQDISGLANGSHTIKVKATDVVTRESSEYVKTIILDKISPVVSISSVNPVVNVNQVNGDITINATVTDINGLEDVRYWILTSPTAEPTWGTLGYTSFPSVPYSVVIDTINDLTDNTEYKIWVIARDKAGNDSTTSKIITVNQASDMPAVLFSNIDKTQTSSITMNATPSLTKNLFTSDVKIIGTVSDDDSVDVVTNKIQISVNGNSYTDVEESGTTNGSLISWSHNISQADLVDGNNYFNIRATDINGKLFTSSSFYIFVDKSDPTVTVTSPLQSAYVNGAARTAGEAFDGNIDTFTITANNSSTSSVIDVATASNWSLDNTETTGDFYWDSVNKKYKWDFSLDYLPDSYENTAITISYKAKDKFNKVKEVTRSITVDTDAPVIEMQYPTLSSVVTGSVTIKGTTSDEKMSKVEMLLGNVDDTNPANWETLTGKYNWSKTINTVAPAVYGLGINQGDGTYKFPVKVRATDDAGNVTTEDSYFFYISPDLDKPTISVTTPANNSKLGGSILMIGTATDNEAVSKVYVRIDVNGDGDYSDSFDLDGTVATHMFDNESVWNEITQFSNNVWEQEINSDGLLYEENPNIIGATGVINVQFKAVDIKGVESLLVTRTIDIDKTFPEITTFGVSGGSSDVKGSFTIDIGATDVGGGIKTIDISFNGGISYEPVFVWDNVTAPITRTDSVTKDSITDLGYLNSSNILSVRLRVTDTTGYQSFSNIQLNIDNITPNAGYTARVDNIGTNDGDTNLDLDIISGTYQDSGLVSSFDRVEVYIAQDGILKNPKTGNTVTSTTIDFNDGNGSVIYPANTVDLIKIDNLIEQGSDTGANGDNDGYNEYITSASGIYNWSVIYDTSNINPANGAVELHYVVYDKAGNAHHYVEIMLIVGSDLDESGSVDSFEQVAYPQSFQARSGLLYVELYSGTKAGYNIEVTDTLGGSVTTTAPNTNALIDTSTYSNGEVDFTIKVYEGATLKLTKVLSAEMKGADEEAPIINVANLSQSSVLLGHLDLGDYVTGEPSDSNDYDVSGLVQFTGSVTDETRIKDIILSISGETDITLAEWDGGIFKSVDPNMTIVSQSIHWKDGHTVNFTYNWDTETITGIAANNKVVTFKANDFIVTHEVSDIDQYDVVPYITNIVRNSTYNNHRAKSGYYSLLRGETNNKITGYNLNTGGSLMIDSNKSGAAGTTVNITGYSVNGDNSEITFTLPTTARSGWLRLVVNGVEAINNLNDNQVATNKENNTYLSETTYWNDDRYIRVWQSNATDKFDQSDNPIYPTMGMNSSGTLYSSFSNYSDSSVFYSTLTASSRTKVFYTYDPPEETEIIVTDSNINILYSANYHGGTVASWNSSVGSAGGLYLYDNNAPNIYAGRTNERIYRFELFYHNRMLQQFKNIRGARGTNNMIHSAYYDRLSNSIKYAYVEDGYNPASSDTHEFPWINLDGNSDADDTAAYTRGSSVVLSAARYEGGLTRSTATDEFLSITVDDQNLPLVVYTDAGTGRLRLARANSATPNANTNWSVQSILSSGDINYSLARDYYSAKVDTSGILHIVFRNSKGELCYVKSTNNPTGGAAYTFGTSVVIDTDGLWADLTLKGTTPYISYLSKVNAYDGIKIAFYDNKLDLDGNNILEGGWETMTAAMNYKAGNIRTSIEAHPNGTGTNWTAAVGYTPGNEYRVVYYIGE